MAPWGLLRFYTNIKIICPNSVKRALGVLIGIALDLQIALSSVVTVTVSEYFKSFTFIGGESTYNVVLMSSAQRIDSVTHIRLSGLPRWPSSKKNLPAIQETCRRGRLDPRVHKTQFKCQHFKDTAPTTLASAPLLLRFCLLMACTAI